MSAHTVINAEMAKLIQPFVSTEETRYYLNGFCVAIWLELHANDKE